MMNALLHSLNISTLATWLSVGGFGTVGVLLPEWQPTHPYSATSENNSPQTDTLISLGDPNGGLNTLPGATEETFSREDQALPEIPDSADTLPAPPEMPALHDFSPLPEIPDVPRPAASAHSTSKAVDQSPPKRSSAISSSGAARASSSASRTGSSSSGSASGSGMNQAARLAAGRMPPPSYPSEARRKGQSGTVLVEFTVDASGRVISAYAKNPSPWQLLNNEAVRTVRRWKFPPGTVMKLQRPIVFQLR